MSIQYHNIHDLAKAVSKAISESTEDSNIGINTTHTWTNKPTADTFNNGNAGQAWFPDLRVMGYSDSTNWSIPNKPIRKTPVKIALFGDSTATTGTYTSNDNCEIIDLAFPASGTTESSVTSTRYMTHMEYPVAMLARNCGIASQTTVAMLARDLAVASATRKAATDLANANVDVIIFRGGSINNVTPLTTYTQSDINTIVADHKSMLSRLISTGAAIIDEGIAGYLIANGTTVAEIGKQAVVVAVNLAIKDYIESLNNPNVRFLNPVGVTCTEVGTWISGYSTDGVHCVIAGQISIAKAEAAILTEMFGPSAKIQFPGTNLSPNPMLATVTTVTAGTLATGFTLPTDDAWKDVTLAQVEVVDGIPMQTCVITQNGAGANSITMSLPLTLADLAIVSGDVFGVEFDYFVRKLDGTNLPVGATVNAVFSLKKVSNGTVKNTAMSYTTSASMSEAKGHVSFNKLKINDDLANLETPIFTFVYYPLLADAIAANAVKIGVGGVRIVK